MGKSDANWRKALYGPQRALTLESRLYVLLRDELGMERQPKVARLLVNEIIEVVQSTLIDSQTIKPGQLHVLAVEIGQGASWSQRSLEDKKLKAVRLTLIDGEDIDRLIAGDPIKDVRKQRMVRLTREAYAQGAALTTCQLAMMTGVSPSRVSSQLQDYTRETGEIIPVRGIVDDCSRALTHKTQIIARHLDGQSTAEIAKATSHTPRSVERYIKRFEQIRTLVRYLDTAPSPAIIARILSCSVKLVEAYLELLPPEKDTPALPDPAGG